MTQLAAVVDVPTEKAGAVLVREITLGEVRAHLAAAAAREQAAPDSAGQLDAGALFVGSLLGGFGPADLKRFSDLTDERLELLTPSELKKVYEAVKSLNPDFFAVLDQWADALVERMTSDPISNGAP